MSPPCAMQKHEAVRITATVRSDGMAASALGNFEAAQLQRAVSYRPPPACLLPLRAFAAAIPTSKHRPFAPAASGDERQRKVVTQPKGKLKFAPRSLWSGNSRTGLEICRLLPLCHVGCLLIARWLTCRQGGRHKAAWLWRLTAAFPKAAPARQRHGPQRKGRPRAMMDRPGRARPHRATPWAQWDIWRRVAPFFLLFPAISPSSRRSFSSLFPPLPSHRQIVDRFVTPPSNFPPSFKNRRPSQIARNTSLFSRQRCATEIMQIVGASQSQW